MSKADIVAFEYARTLSEDYNQIYDAVKYGYHQAEKDLELTWEDIRELYIIFAEVDVEIDFYKTDIKTETLGYYQEILRRFKERKL